MGNEGAVLSGMKEAPEKFSDTIRMFPLSILSISLVLERRGKDIKETDR